MLLVFVCFDLCVFWFWLVLVGCIALLILLGMLFVLGVCDVLLLMLFVAVSAVHVDWFRLVVGYVGCGFTFVWVCLC